MISYFRWCAFGMSRQDGTTMLINKLIFRLSTMRDSVDSRSCLYMVVFSFSAFNVLNKLIFTVFPPPEKFRNQNKKVWLWENTSTSWVHSVITAVLSVYSLAKEPLMLEDLINPWNSLSFYTLAFSAGYFVYDFLNLIVNDREKSFCISVHHIIVVTAFLIALFNKKYIPFGLVALLMEVNSVFLHSRRLMRMSDVNPSSKLFKINGILLTVTFVIFRLVTCGWMLNFLMTNRHLFPTFHFVVGSGGLCVLMPQNIFLLKQVWNSDSKSNAENQMEKDLKDSEKQLAPNGLPKLKQFLNVVITHGSD